MLPFGAFATAAPRLDGPCQARSGPLPARQRICMERVKWGIPPQGRLRRRHALARAQARARKPTWREASSRGRHTGAGAPESSPPQTAPHSRRSYAGGDQQGVTTRILALIKAQQQGGIRIVNASSLPL